MTEHVRALGMIGIARGFLAAGLGAWLLVKASALTADDYGRGSQSKAEANLRLDQPAFVAVGGLCVGVAIVRVVQAVGALLARRWARRLGLALAILDIANLILFPLSTALGLYGLVVYRHPDTLDYFREPRTGRAAGGRRKGGAHAAAGRV